MQEWGLLKKIYLYSWKMINFDDSTSREIRGVKTEEKMEWKNFSISKFWNCPKIKKLFCSFPAPNFSREKTAAFSRENIIKENG